MTATLRATARLLGIATLLPPVLIAWESGSFAQTSLFAGFLAAALAGVVKHGVGKPLVGFETFLLCGLAVSALVSTGAWSLVDRQPEIALKAGQLCEGVGEQIAPAVRMFVAGMLAGMAAAALGIWRSRDALRQDRNGKADPPLNAWIVVGMVLYLAAATAVCILNYNRSACSLEFLPMSLVLPMLTTFTAILGIGYCTAALAIRGRDRAGGGASKDGAGHART